MLFAVNAITTILVITLLSSHSYESNGTTSRKQNKYNLSRKSGNEQKKQPGNKEFESLLDGKADIRRRARLLNAKSNFKINKRKIPLLCATFLNASLPQTQYLFSNIKIMHEYCDWAVIIYDDRTMPATQICSNQTILPYLVHCNLAAVLESKKVHITSINNQDIVSIPKVVLYRELFPMLPYYEEVFLLDDDVSLAGGMFDPVTFLRAYRTAFGSDGPPLIAQPLLHDTPVMHDFLNYDHWQNISSSNSSSQSNRRKAIAAQVQVVEPLANIVQSAFFEWLVRRVLVHTRELSLKLGVDWGLNRVWCKAAAAYSALVLHSSPFNISTVDLSAGGVNSTADLDYSSYLRYLNSNFSESNRSSSGCAVIIAGGPVLHIHGLSTTRAGMAIRLTKDVFKKNAKSMFRKYLYLFPNWLSMESTREMDPLGESGRSLGLRVVYEPVAI